MMLECPPLAEVPKGRRWILTLLNIKYIQIK